MHCREKIVCCWSSDSDWRIPSGIYQLRPYKTFCCASLINCTIILGRNNCYNIILEGRPHHMKSTITKILLIEDSIPDAELLRMFLNETEGHGFSLHLADRLSKGLTDLQEQNFD